MAKVIADQDKNVFTYSLVSLIVMFMLSFTIHAAKSGYDWNGNVYGQTMNEITGSASLFDQLNKSSGSNYKDIAANVTTSYQATNLFDPLSNAVNWLGATGKVFSIVGIVVTMGTLWIYAGQVGGVLGVVLMLVTLIWQMSVGYYIMTFILPRLKR